uniref:Heme binding protein 1 n=1 Tax=Falco tinnunculus TaxID=100819 RepID=A0A8C4UIR2_FALTI
MLLHYFPLLFYFLQISSLPQMNTTCFRSLLLFTHLSVLRCFTPAAAALPLPPPAAAAPSPGRAPPAPAAPAPPPRRRWHLGAPWRRCGALQAAVPSPGPPTEPSGPRRSGAEPSAAETERGRAERGHAGHDQELLAEHGRDVALPGAEQRGKGAAQLRGEGVRGRAVCGRGGGREAVRRSLEGRGAQDPQVCRRNQRKGQFGGYAKEMDYVNYAAKLKSALGSEVAYRKDFYFCNGYDPPMKPYGRRNEVWFVKE